MLAVVDQTRSQHDSQNFCRGSCCAAYEVCLYFFWHSVGIAFCMCNYRILEPCIYSIVVNFIFIITCCRVAKLYIISNGQGSPCLDLRRIPGQLADATVGADLVILEGMGRAVLSNLRAQFKCPVLKLAMIKTRYLAEQLFHGEIYDCVCIYDQGAPKR